MKFGPMLTVPKEEVFRQIRSYLDELAVDIVSVDSERPWGGFFVIDETSTDRFIQHFFPNYNVENIKQFGSKLSPKILIVGPEEELSWQYHDRRAELWRCVEGPVGYRRSLDNTQSEVITLDIGEIVQFAPSERHRLVGNGRWGVVAEFWQHTDPNNPSDEEDIIRLEDKYGRIS